MKFANTSLFKSEKLIKWFGTMKIENMQDGHKKNIGLEVKANITDNERGVCVTFGQIAGAKIHLDNYKGQALFSKARIIIKSADIISKQIIGSIKY